MSVSLKLLGADELNVVVHIALDPGQEPFAGGPLSLVFGKLRGSGGTGGEYPFAIYAFCEVIGFVLLRAQQVAPSWAPPDAITLHNLRIDSEQQGRGYAKQAIRLLLDWVTTNLPTARRAALCVNHRNEHARQIYLACGFADTGQTIVGALGPQSILVCELPAAESRADP
jgi:cysteine synthase A